MTFIRNYTNYDSNNLMADSFASTSTSYETTEVSSTAVVLDCRNLIGAKVNLNVILEAISAAGTETYGMKIDDGDAAAFTGLYESRTIVVDKATPLGALLQPIEFVVKYGYIRLQVIGANTPNWTLSAWLAPAD